MKKVSELRRGDSAEDWIAVDDASYFDGAVHLSILVGDAFAELQWSDPDYEIEVNDVQAVPDP